MNAVTTGREGSRATLAAEVLHALAAIEHAAAESLRTRPSRLGADSPVALAGASAVALAGVTPVAPASLTTCLLATDPVMMTANVVHLLYDTPLVARPEHSPSTTAQR